MEHPDRLSSIINYALLLHCFEHDMARARQLYKRASDLAPHNPLVMRAHALFKLASCEAPRAASFAQALKMLSTAKARDAGGEKFDTAKRCYFHWGMVAQPHNAQALLNWALVRQSIDRFDAAERARRAVSSTTPTSRCSRTTTPSSSSAFPAECTPEGRGVVRSGRMRCAPTRRRHTSGCCWRTSRRDGKFSKFGGTA